MLRQTTNLCSFLSCDHLQAIQVQAFGSKAHSSSSTSSNTATTSSSGINGWFQKADGLFKGAATLSMSSSDDERIAADAAAEGLVIPKHWEQQIRTASLGRRRVLQR